MKTCAQCNLSKSGDALSFYKDKRNEDGLYTICKTCHKNNMVQFRISTATKRCRDCKEYLRVDKFNCQRVNTDLLCLVCISCNFKRVELGIEPAPHRKNYKRTKVRLQAIDRLKRDSEKITEKLKKDQT